MRVSLSPDCWECSVLMQLVSEPIIYHTEYHDVWKTFNTSSSTKQYANPWVKIYYHLLIIVVKIYNAILRLENTGSRWPDLYLHIAFFRPSVWKEVPKRQWRSGYLLLIFSNLKSETHFLISTIDLVKASHSNKLSTVQNATQSGLWYSSLQRVRWVILEVPDRQQGWVMEFNDICPFK